MGTGEEKQGAAGSTDPGSNKLILLVLRELSDSYASLVAGAFERSAAQRGYNVIATALDNKADHSFCDHAIKSYGINAVGVVGYASGYKLSDDKLELLAESGINVVTIGRPIASPHVSQVVYRNDEGVVSALEYLLEQGAERFWILGQKPEPPSPYDVNSLRAELAQHYLETKLLKIPPLTLVAPGASVHHGYCAIEEAIREYPPLPDAVFCTSDDFAWGALKAFAAARFEVGRDLAVVGYNDDYFSRLITPPLTTVAIPSSELGYLAADLLIDMCEGKEEPGQRVFLDTELVVRESGTFKKKDG